MRVGARPILQRSFVATGNIEISSRSPRSRIEDAADPYVAACHVQALVNENLRSRGVVQAFPKRLTDSDERIPWA